MRSPNQNNAEVHAKIVDLEDLWVRKSKHKLYEDGLRSKEPIEESTDPSREYTWKI